MSCNASMTAGMFSQTCNIELTPPRKVIVGDPLEKKIFKMILKQYELDYVTQDKDHFNEAERMQVRPPLVIHYFHPSDPTNRFVWRFKTLKVYSVTRI